MQAVVQGGNGHSPACLVPHDVAKMVDPRKYREHICPGHQEGGSELVSLILRFSSDASTILMQDEMA